MTHIVGDGWNGNLASILTRYEYLEIGSRRFGVVPKIMDAIEQAVKAEKEMV